MTDNAKVFTGLCFFIAVVYIAGYVTGYYIAKTEELDKQIEYLKKERK